MLKPIGKSGWPPRGCSVLYINVEREYLSEPYGLREGDMIVGKIIEVKHRRSIDPSIARESYPEFRGREVHFRLLTERSVVGLGKDMLFLTKDDWIDFREHGITPRDSLAHEYTLEVELEKANLRNGEEIALFPKRIKYVKGK